jgi:hypothetical protein
MSIVYKTLLLGMLAGAALAAVIFFSIELLNISSEIGALMIVLGACGAGLIGGEVSRRMPPPQRRH